MKYIIFDFNGTIISDVEVCRKCINILVDKYLDREPIDLDEYKHIFTFPVKDYYEKAGFDFEIFDWHYISNEFMDEYNKRHDEYDIFEGAIDVLKRSHELGNKNILLSASEINNLKTQLKELNIEEYFDEVLGIENIYASSKLHVAEKFMEDKNSNDCLFIGDTLHDLEIAKALGVECILVSSGHQARDILEGHGALVIDDIKELKL